MPARKGWLTPNAPLPSDTVCRRILIPADLQIIAAVNGALLELTKNYNWEQFGSASPEEVAEAMLSMYLDYVSEPCGGGGGCRRIYRIGQGGLIEMSDDAGETWQSAATEIPPTPARNEPTEEERLCNAAANAVNVLHQTYEEMIDAWQLDSSVDFGIGAFATILGLLVGSWLGVVTAAAIPFVWELFGSVYATIGTFLQDAWDSDFTNELTCLFLEAASDMGGVVTFNWSAISQSLADRVAETAAPEDALLWLQLNYMVLFIGVEGLNAAGATTGVVGDCDDCDGWCYTFDFTQGTQGWTPYVQNGEARAVFTPEGWRANPSGTGEVKGLIQIEYPSFPSTVITGWRIFVANAIAGTDTQFRAPNVSGAQYSVQLTMSGLDEQGALVPEIGVTGFWASYRKVGAIAYDSNMIIEKIVVTGQGINPFGQDNCE